MYVLLHRVVIGESWTLDDCEGERERECVCGKSEYDESSSCSRLFFRAFAKKSCDIWLEAFSRVVRGFIVVVVFFRPFFLYREIDTVELFSAKLF